MLAALTLCLGLQSGVAGAVADTGARALHVFIEDEAGMLLVEGWSVQLGRLSGTTVRWLETVRVDATSGVAEFAAIDEPTNFVQAVHDTGELSRHELVALGPTPDGALAAVHRLVFDRPRPERSLYVQVNDPFVRALSSLQTLVAIDGAGREFILEVDPGTPAVTSLETSSREAIGSSRATRATSRSCWSGTRRVTSSRCNSSARRRWWSPSSTPSTAAL